MDMSGMRQKLCKLNSWLDGTRIVHLDNDEDTTFIYAKTASPILKQNMMSSGENIKYDTVKNCTEFKEECVKNSLKAVVVDAQLEGGKCGVDIAYDLYQEKVIKCPIFFLTSEEDSFSDEQKMKIGEMGAHLVEKHTEDLSEVKSHIESFVSGEMAA